MTAILVDADKVADAMRTHVISKAVPKPATDEIVEVPAPAKTRTVQGKYARGQRTEECKFCKKMWNKVNLHIQHCAKNPNRVPGPRAVDRGLTILVKNRKKSAIEEQFEVLSASVFSLYQECGPDLNTLSADEILARISQFNAWVDMTKEMLDLK